MSRHLIARSGPAGARTPVRIVLVALTFVVALLLGACGGATDESAQRTDSIATSQDSTTTPEITGPAPLPEVAAVQAVGVQIPSIGVDAAPLESLGLLADGSLSPPVDFARAGWFVDGPVPGQVGPSVIAGHIDSAAAGPAVFFRLHELQPGAEVVVALSDGSSATFRVDRVLSAPKDSFPTAEVYGPTPDAQLRLITCGGSFNPVAGSYLDNTIVFATAVA